MMLRVLAHACLNWKVNKTPHKAIVTDSCQACCFLIVSSYYVGVYFVKEENKS